MSQRVRFSKAYLDLIKSKISNEKDVDSVIYLGKMCFYTNTDRQFLSHYDYALNYLSFAIRFDPTGILVLNAKTGSYVNFTVNNSSKGFISAVKFNLAVPIDMNNNKINELATPILDYDASTKKYVDDAVNHQYVSGSYTGNGGATRVIDSTNQFSELTIVRTDGGAVGAYKKFVGMAGFNALNLVSGVYTNNAISFGTPGFTVFNLLTNVNLATYVWSGFV